MTALMIKVLWVTRGRGRWGEPHPSCEVVGQQRQQTVSGILQSGEVIGSWEVVGGS